MTFLADENVDRPIVERLRKDGHVVFYVVEMQPGTPDKQVFDTANREKALLLTADKGFGELGISSEACNRRRNFNTSGRIVSALQGGNPQRRSLWPCKRANASFYGHHPGRCPNKKTISIKTGACDSAHRKK